MDSPLLPVRHSVFVSYSHRDSEWLDRLKVHLRPLVRDHAFVVWDDTKIDPGTKWKAEIKTALATTKVAILLVSADFLASDFVATNELPPLLAAARDDGAVVLPLILSPSRFLHTPPLAEFQALNDPSRPLISLTRSEQEEILVRATEAVERAMQRNSFPEKTGTRRELDKVQSETSNFASQDKDGRRGLTPSSTDFDAAYQRDLSQRQPDVSTPSQAAPKKTRWPVRRLLIRVSIFLLVVVLVGLAIYGWLVSRPLAQQPRPLHARDNTQTTDGSQTTVFPSTERPSPKADNALPRAAETKNKPDKNPFVNETRNYFPQDMPSTPTDSPPTELRSRIDGVWSLGTNMPTARMGPFTGTIGTKIYVIGGEDNHDVLPVNEIYDSNTKKWTTGADMPTPRWLGATAVVDNILYAIGGGLRDGGTTVVEAYDPRTNTWSEKHDSPQLGGNIYAVVIGDVVFVIGGMNRQGSLGAVWAYYPKKDEWVQQPSLNIAKRLSAVGVLGSAIIVAGGLAKEGITSDNERYDLKTKTWVKLSQMTRGRQGGCFAASSGLLLYAGGQDDDQHVTDVLEAYNLRENRWSSALASMPYAVANSGSAELAGRLYCFGGSDGGLPFQGKMYNYVQIYQPTGAGKEGTSSSSAR